MRALIVAAAPVPGAEDFYRALVTQAPFVIGADAGAAFAASLGRVPDIAVGDFDSSPPGTAESLAEAGSRVVLHPARKDETDLDLALEAARAEDLRGLAFTAAFSGRLDHTLAAVGTLMRAVDLDAEVREPELTAWVVGPGRRGLRFVGEPGSLLSVVAPAGAGGVSLSGVRYPLADARLDPMSSLGVSNVLVSEEAVVEVLEGVAIVLAHGLGAPPSVRLK